MNPPENAPGNFPCSDITPTGNSHALSDDELIRQTLRDIMSDTAAPAAAKAQAARTMAEMQQLLGRNQRETHDASQPVKEMNRAAMLAELAEISG